MTAVEEVKKRVLSLEDALKELAMEQTKTSIELRKFKNNTERIIERLANTVEQTSKDMRDFKDEMRDFKDEMREFKDRMEQMKKDLNKKWGDLANKMGTIVEDLVIPNLPAVLKKDFGLGEPDIVMQRIKRRIKSKGLIKEFDAILVYNEPKVVVLNETKSKADKDSIEEFAEFIRGKNFFEFYPEYRDYILLPIYSSIFLDAHHVDLLTRRNIFAVHIEGDILTFKNLDKVKKHYNL